MKAVLISIQPKWVEKIANGEKTIEVRKSRPKLQTPFKVYIYETQGEYKTGTGIFAYGIELKGTKKGKGKVVGEFVCDKVLEWKYLSDHTDENEYEYYIVSKDGHATCLTYDEIENYGKGKTLYGWHISELKIYDKPKELSEFELACHCFNIKNVECKTNAFGEYVFQHNDNSFCRICKYYNSDFGDCDKPAFQPLKRPPQSWCYIEN